MQKLNIFLKAADNDDYHQLFVQYIILVILFIVVVIIFSVMMTFMKLTYRKHEVVYCKALLKEKEKITDKEDYVMLQNLLPRIEKYHSRWWYNNPFLFFSFKKKLRKISTKYNLEINVWND